MREGATLLLKERREHAAEFTRSSRAEPEGPGIKRSETNMSLTMQAIFANTFAAAMTFAVITFPSPQALWSSVTDYVHAQENRTDRNLIFPDSDMPDEMLAVARFAGEGYDTEFAERLTACAFFLSRANRIVSTDECRDAIDITLAHHPDLLDQMQNPGADALAEQVLYTAFQICRYEFATGQIDPDRMALCKMHIMGLASGA